MAFIEFIGVRKFFGQKEVHAGVDLKIEKGETMTILGGSGSGKTILLKILLGLIQPDSGKILFDGKDLLTMNITEIRKVRQRVGMLFQGGALFDSLSVEENVAYPLRENFKMSEKEMDKVVAEKLELVGLPGIQTMMPSDLSGGMKKRVALARAIAVNPEVILYDEPTTGLDPINTNRINVLIRDLQAKLKVTSVVVTHDMNSAFMISDRLALIDKGRIAFTGNRKEFEHSTNPLVHSFVTGEFHAAS